GEGAQGSRRRRDARDPCRSRGRNPARRRRRTPARQRRTEEGTHAERRPENRRRDRAQGALLAGAPDRHQFGGRRVDRRRQDPREEPILVRIRRPERRIRQSRHQGHHRPNQGCAGGAAECSVDRWAPDHDGSHGRRKAEEGKCGARYAWRWNGWHGRYGLLILPSQRNDEGPGFFRAFLSCAAATMKALNALWSYGAITQLWE